MSNNQAKSTGAWSWNAVSSSFGCGANHPHSCVQTCSSCLRQPEWKDTQFIQEWSRRANRCSGPDEAITKLYLGQSIPYSSNTKTGVMIIITMLMNFSIAPFHAGAHGIVLCWLKMWKGDQRLKACHDGQATARHLGRGKTWLKYLSDITGEAWRTMYEDTWIQYVK